MNFTEWFEAFRNELGLKDFNGYISEEDAMFYWEHNITPEDAAFKYMYEND
jgi:hypothetical protein